MDLKVDQRNNTTRLLIIRRLEVIKAVVSEDEPASAPTLVLPSCIQYTSTNMEEYGRGARGQTLPSLVR